MTRTSSVGTGTLRLYPNGPCRAQRTHTGPVIFTLVSTAHEALARESNMHVVAETLQWFDKHVKNAKPRATTTSSK